MPRPGHIANLTTGTKFPLKPIDNDHISVILSTVLQAWQELLNEGSNVLQTGSETEVSALLGPRLNQLRDSDSKWANLVSAVSFGSEAINYDGSRIQTKPDLHFILTRRNANFPLIVECKLIDYPRKKDVHLYCTKGIVRFVAGDYAWTNREAIMIAYVRDGSTIQQRLVPHLITASQKNSDPQQTISPPVHCPDIHPLAYQSEHRRSFKYLAGVNGDEPEPISLFHLWLPQ